MDPIAMRDRNAQMEDTKREYCTVDAGMDSAAVCCYDSAAVCCYDMQPRALAPRRQCPARRTNPRTSQTVPTLRSLLIGKSSHR